MTDSDANYNTFNLKPQTNLDVINLALKSGPLSKEEVRRRAEIAASNQLNFSFEDVVTDLVRYPAMHPETRQVSAMTAIVYAELADHLGMMPGSNPEKEDS